MPEKDSDRFLYEKTSRSQDVIYGTGFFIASDGLSLTNWHVISANPACLSNYGCELIVGTTQPDGKFTEQTKYFKVLAEVDILMLPY